MPRKIGKYEIAGIIGQGGMGTVYHALDPVLRRSVALKILHFERLDDVSPQELADRFRNEARVVAHLNHPGIVTVYDYAQDGRRAFIAMEYVGGLALDEYAAHRKGLGVGECVTALVQVLDALYYAHGKSVVHRDIKPANLLVNSDGKVKITDFGIARIGERNRTQTGILVGTMQYMAPEQFLGGAIDYRCDIHAAGIVLYELLTGVSPFDNVPGLAMHKVCDEMPTAPSQVKQGVPAVFDKVIARALAKKPADRYANAREFRDAVTTAYESLGTGPASATLPEVPSRPRTPTTIIRRPTGKSASSPRRSSPAAASAAPPKPASRSPKSSPKSPRVTPNISTEAAGSAPAGPTPGQAAASGEAAGDAPGNTPGAVAPAVVRSPSGAIATTSPTSSPSGSVWLPEYLSKIERQLVPIVGPVARLMVKKAASCTGDRHQLIALLANDLSPHERERFTSVAAHRLAPQAAPNSGDASRAQMTVFGPTCVTRRDRFFLQAIFHPLGADRDAIKLAQIVEPDPSVAQVLLVPGALTTGEVITVRLRSDPRVQIDESQQTLVWAHGVVAAQFAVRVPRLDWRHEYVFVIDVVVSGVPVGRCKFRLSVARTAPTSEARRRYGTLSRYRQAFLSYAAEDAAEVANVAQVLESVGLEYFLDQLSLRSGSKWRIELRKNIERADLFLLCWSQHAAKSSWVRKEIDWALKTQRRMGEERPEIRPVLLDGPSIPPPPRGLRHLHFNSAPRLMKASLTAMERA